MTRHQRRKRARLLKAAAQRREIVRSNLSTPRVETVRERGSLVSGIYRGEIGRARGMGSVPMTHKVWAVIADRPEIARVLYPSGTKILKRKR